MLVWTASHTGAAFAECTDPPPLEDALRESPIAIIGEVTAAGLDADEATISVQWIWKGPDLPEELVLQTPSTPTLSGEVGFRFRAGTTYIIFLQDTTGPYEVGECSGTRRYRSDGQAIPPELQLAAGATAGRAPGAPADGAIADEGGIGLTYIAPAAVLAIGLMALAATAYRRKRRARPSSDLLKRRIPAVDGVMSSRRTSGDRRMQRLRRRNKK
jgi:hypothetical protein